MPAPDAPRRTTLKRETVDAVAGVMARARSALFITGAGISAESGLPTYRGIGGLYEEDDRADGVPVEVALSGSMFGKHPEITWKYIHQIELACRGARPNRAHEIIALISERLERSLVLTQNVDGFHTAAGSKHVIEIHGNIHDLRCTRCAWKQTVPDFSALSFPPKCPRCKAVVRPNVVLFGEALAVEPFQRLEEELARGFDIVFSVGTTSVSPYIARPVLIAKSEGIPTVEVNPGKTEVSDIVDYPLRAGARSAFKALWSSYKDLVPRRTRLGH
jgi:NAD-dependent deacetylase